MDAAILVSSAAAIASVASFTPQAWKIIRDRKTDGLSAGMYGLTCTAFLLWVSYGAMVGQWPLVVSNAICLISASFILAMILLPQRLTRKVAKKLDPTTEK